MALDETVSVLIGRPPSDVFRHLIAVERWPEWLIASGIVGVERASGDAPLGVDAPLGLGSALEIRQVLAGVRSSTLITSVTALEGDARFAVAGKDADGVSVDLDAVLAAEGTGTRLTWRVRIGLPFRLRVFEGMARPQVRRAAMLDLEAFRIRLETVAEGGA